eukprot:CAMPEP_0201565414 /NCGR_PEP_ID=MMETSP0190_2-20130828/4517_1 /ASSEMBLY_ACC=CAM_ASM_000263 /TAXON_ID=37353 /ORGANISM="Rosalina sp." /LENGTH=454 /DNA_ID=CAMNT_0047982865 /DNA_START=334 /DNA_END=1698 /DNA_ORIENTATION=+
MIIDAEKSGRIKKGDTLIEPTSGNTGIGLALAAAIKGYKMVITLPEKMSNEKVYTLRALGAKIYRTPTEAAFDSPESHIGLANRLNAEIENSHILDQYSNPSNPLAHYDGTAEEIIKQCNGKVDMVVLTAGTGGTITGIAGKIKEKIPSCIIVGVDPKGSILAQPDTMNGPIESYHVEGIGYDFVPQVLQRKLVDYWVKTDDKESFYYSRRLIREEGLLCGGSSGSAFAGAIKAIREFHAKTGINAKGKRVVILLPDSIRNYMTKFLSDDWMIDNNFLDFDEIKNDDKEQEDDKGWWYNDTVASLNVSPPITMSSNLSCKTAIDIMKKKGIDQIPIMNNDEIYGVVSVGNLSSKLLKGRVSPNDKVTKATFKKFKAVSLQTPLTKLSQIFNIHHFVLVVTESEQYNDNGTISKKQMVVGIITRIDLLNYIVSHGKKTQSSKDKNDNNDDTQDIE